MTDISSNLLEIHDQIDDASGKLKSLSSLICTLRGTNQEIQKGDLLAIENYLDWVHDELVGTSDLLDSVRNVKAVA